MTAPTLRSRLLRVLLLFLFLWLVGSPVARAHGGDPETMALAGALAWGFLAFGLVVIVAVGWVLFSGQPPTPGSNRAAAFAGQSGFAGYIAKMRMFSRNARLYMIHVVGMDVIYGTWMVLFNLYLLAVGFDVAFVGLRILLAAAASAIFALPAGIISDRIGRKLSFVLGDGLGAVMSLIAISTSDPTIILVTGFVGGVFGSLHGVAEPAFMAENSEDFERVHLFSVAGGARTAAAIIGSALAGLVPLLFAGADGGNLVGLYRTVAYLGIGGWFASLIPAVLLQQSATDRAKAPGLRQLFSAIKHPDRILRLTAPEVLLALGAGFALPLMNVFFSEGLGSSEVEIGATFAAGQAFLVVGAFLAPLLAARLGKVTAVAATRLIAIPFILLIAFSGDVGGALGSVFTVAGLAHIARLTFSNMASPVQAAFAMEILDPQERGTQVGLQLALAAALSGLAGYAGAQMMAAGNFALPFLLMAVIYLAGILLFWRFFGGKEDSLALSPVTEPQSAD
ncbi:MAG: MFS transporter [Caldilineaceae bacterium]|nr:MFS transporter [Caldilineaceae bacterium]HRJ40463.1 MFS transporter [Caldilineaceae bacterium]